MAIGHIKEAGVISLGISAPAWVQYIEYANIFLAFLIAVCTLIYAFVRAFNAVFEWRESWAERKKRERKTFGVDERRKEDEIL